MSSIPYPSPSDIPYPSTPDLSPALSRQKTSVQSSPEDWKEMKDPNTGRSYWVNHVTRQMSYNPPARKTSPPSSGANNALGKHSPGTCSHVLPARLHAMRARALSAVSACSGLSRLDELLERYEKITAQNRTMKEEKVTTEPDTLASPLLIKTQATHAQRGAAPPPRDASMLPSPASGKPAVSPASGKPAVSPSSLFASNPVRENERRSEMHGPSYDSEVRQNFVRIQANKIPNSVDLLEAYVHQPNALLDLPPSVPETDPLIRLYGLSMFVDNYAPATEARSETTTISQADAILADLQKILQHDLLRGHDIGSTRQIGDTKKKPAQFNNLAVGIVFSLFEYSD
jgi:hypothetical protein